MKIFELRPPKRKSFNGKCKVIEDKGIAKLLSYETIVAELDLKSKEYIQYGDYSRTTQEHIKAFKNFYGL